MDYELNYTQTDNTSFQHQSWMLSPFDTAQVVVEPPAKLEGVDSFVVENFSNLGGFQFVERAEAARISDEKHTQLLEESLREYREIWRRLAQR